MSLLDNDLSIYEQFKTYFPQWLLEFYEFDEILKCEASIAEKMQTSLDLLIDNHFLDYMDENAIIQFEKFLKIIPSVDEIDYRRNLIKAHCRGRGKLSMSQIVYVVEVLTDGKCVGTFSPRDSIKNNEIKLTLSDVDIRYGLVDVLKLLLNRIPAHLWLNLIYEPAILDLNLSEKLTSSTSIENYITTAGERTEHVQNNSVANVNSSTSIENLIIAVMITLDCGNFTEHYEDIIDGGDFTASSVAIIDFNY